MTLSVLSVFYSITATAADLLSGDHTGAWLPCQERFVCKHMSVTCRPPMSI
jgi:hypothetical protein